MEELKSLEDLQRDHLINAINTLRSEFNKLLLSQQLQPLPKEIELSWEEYGKRIYVPTRAKNAFEQNDFLLTDEMNRFLNDQSKKIAVILGDPGSGKTTFAKRWLAERFQIYEKTKKTFLPVFIELQQVLNKNYVTPNKLLEEYFKTVIGLSSPEITAIRSMPLLVLCDGYDEVSYEGNLYQDNRWSEWPQAKFIITTRPEKFGLGRNVSELRDILATTFSPREGDNKGLALYQLHDFNDHDVRLFVQQWQALAPSEWDEVTYLEKFKQIPGLTELTTNPIILSLVLFTLPDLVQHYAAKTSTVASSSSSSAASSSAVSPSAAVEQKHFERINIYDFFVNKWFNHQANKVWKKLEELNTGLKKRLWKLTQSQEFKLTDALYEYTTQLGRWCLRHGVDGKIRIEIPVQETLKAYLLPEKYVALQLTAEEITQVLTALRSGCLLRCDSQHFKFFHKSLVEYFAQEHIFKGTVGKLTSIEDCASLMTEIAEPNLLKLLAERTRENPMFRDYLYAVLRESKKTADVSMAAANAITILSRAKQPFNQESLQGIRIPRADLSYANLHGVDFRDADLTQVNFTRAYLEEANLSGSHLSGCEWGAPPSINFESPVKAVVYPWGRPWVVVGEGCGKIHFVDFISGTIEKTLTHYNFKYGKEDELMSLAVDGSASRATEWLASAAQNGNIYVWKFKGGKAVYQTKLQHPGVRTIALSADGQRLVSGSEDQSIRVWDIESQLAVAVLKGHHGSASRVALSADGQRVVSRGFDDETVRVWDVVSKQAVAILKGHTSSVESIALSADGQRVVSGSMDKSIRVWDVVSQRVVAVLTGHSGSVRSIALSEDGQRVVSGSEDKIGRAHV